MKDKLQNVLLSISSKVETNKYLGSIKEAFTMFVPFIIVGSFGSMLNILVSGANGLAQWVPWLSNLSPAFTAINFVTISCMSLPIAFLIGYKLKDGSAEAMCFLTLSFCQIMFSLSLHEGRKKNKFLILSALVGILLTILATTTFRKWFKNPKLYPINYINAILLALFLPVCIKIKNKYHN